MTATVETQTDAYQLAVDTKHGPLVVSFFRNAGSRPWVNVDGELTVNRVAVTVTGHSWSWDQPAEDPQVCRTIPRSGRHTWNDPVSDSARTIVRELVAGVWADLHGALAETEVDRLADAGALHRAQTVPTLGVDWLDNDLTALLVKLADRMRSERGRQLILGGVPAHSINPDTLVAVDDLLEHVRGFADWAVTPEERRWTVCMDGGLRLQLAADSEEAACQQAALLHPGQQIAWVQRWN